MKAREKRAFMIYNGIRISNFLCALAAAFCIANVSNAQTKQNVVILDGDSISYGAHDGVPNFQVLRTFLEDGLPDYSFDASNYFDVTGTNPDGYEFLPQHAIRVNPVLVFVHWSAFKPEDLERCTVYGSEETVACARRITDLLTRIYHGMKREVKFIIYSRAINLCNPQYRHRFRRLIDHNVEFANNIGLISISGIREKDLNSSRSRADIDLLVSRLLGRGDAPSLTRHQVNDGVCILAGKGY